MEITLTTPALLFPAISLLLLAFTNRFMAIASLIRGLYRERESEKAGRDARTLQQIDRQVSNLRKRVELIRSMQALGIVAFILCTLSMMSIFLGYPIAGAVFFGLSLLVLALSLLQSFREITMSVGALEILLEDLNERK